MDTFEQELNNCIYSAFWKAKQPKISPYLEIKTNIPLTLSEAQELNLRTFREIEIILSKKRWQ